MYKFVHSEASDTKGSPFDVETIDVGVSSLSSIPELCATPIGYGALFSVKTLRRSHYYAVANRDEALVWVQSLMEARQMAVTKRMGHSSHVPYPREWSSFDIQGEKAVRTSERIKTRIENSRLSEMEMTAVVGGPLPRGYYG